MPHSVPVYAETMSNPVMVLLGAGPGIGAALAEKYAREGYDVALVARSGRRLRELAEQVEKNAVTVLWTAVDLTDEHALAAAVTGFGERTGRIDVLHFNPSAFRQQDPLHLSPDSLLEDLRLGVASLLTGLQAARPYMSAGGRITATGSRAADRPWNQAASLGVQKAALRNLVRSIDATLKVDGIRATSLTVNGTLATDTAFAPDLVADALFSAAALPDEGWQVETSYNG